jgi:hypothetical protein
MWSSVSMCWIYNYVTHTRDAPFVHPDEQRTISWCTRIVHGQDGQRTGGQECPWSRWTTNGKDKACPRSIWTTNETDKACPRSRWTIHRTDKPYPPHLLTADKPCPSHSLFDLSVPWFVRVVQPLYTACPDVCCLDRRRIPDIHWPLFSFHTWNSGQANVGNGTNGKILFHLYTYIFIPKNMPRDNGNIHAYLFKLEKREKNACARFSMALLPLCGVY